MNSLDRLKEVNPDLYNLFESCASKVLAKNHDYAGENADFYSNLRASERWGLPGWKSVLVRLGDKISRIEAFAVQGIFEVRDESFIDTCQDAANYFLFMADMWRKEKNSAKKKAGRSGRKVSKVTKRKSNGK